SEMDIFLTGAGPGGPGSSIDVIDTILSGAMVSSPSSLGDQRRRRAVLSSSGDYQPSPLAPVRKYSEPNLTPALSTFAVSREADAAYVSDQLAGRASNRPSTGTTSSVSSGATLTNPQQPQQQQSLFATCMTLIEKLYSFPLFEFYFFPEGTAMYTDPAYPVMIEPISMLWGAFRLGAPLCMIYNQLAVTQPLNVADVSEVVPGQYTKVCKENLYHFVVACRNELQIGEALDFTPSELYKEDTHGFVKVLRMVQVVVSKIEASGLMPKKRAFPLPIPTIDPAASNSDNRSKLIKEMVETERSYIASLEVLQRHMKEVEAQRILNKELVRSIFANLNELLDFQRKFAIALEGTLVLPPSEQRIGRIFIQFELIKLTDREKYPFFEELKEGLEAIKRVTETINEESRRQDNAEKKEELISRVEEWKISPNTFGDLILFEKFMMTSNDQEREYDLYLFENFLLCCKEVDRKKKTRKREPTSAQMAYSIRGSIGISAITRVEDISSPQHSYYALRVVWEDGLESVQFALKCRNSEQVRLWKDRIERLVRKSENGGGNGVDQGSYTWESPYTSVPMTPGGLGQTNASNSEFVYTASGSAYDVSDRYLALRRKSHSNTQLGAGRSGPSSQPFSAPPPTSPLERRPSLSSALPGQVPTDGLVASANAPPVPPVPAGYRQNTFQRQDLTVTTEPFRRPQRQESLPNYLSATPTTPTANYVAGRSQAAGYPGGGGQAAPLASAQVMLGPAGFSDDEDSDDEPVVGMRPMGATGLTRRIRNVQQRPTIFGPARDGLGRRSNGMLNGGQSAGGLGALPPRVSSDRSGSGQPGGNIAGGPSVPVPPAATRASGDGGPSGMPAGMPAGAQQAQYLPRKSSVARVLPGVVGVQGGQGAGLASSVAGWTDPQQLSGGRRAASPPQRRPTVPATRSGSGGDNFESVPTQAAGVAQSNRASSPRGGLVMSPTSATAPAFVSAPAPAAASFTETTPAPPTFVKIKTHYNGEVFMIAMPARSATLADLVARLERKIRLCGGTPPQAQGRAMRILYRAGRGGGGPDGGEAADAATAGLATIESDSDVTRAFAEAAELGGTTLSVFVS
ncbi:hypothetical protein HK405_006915, partial [Cladochytrium tenue]